MLGQEGYRQEQDGILVVAVGVVPPIFQVPVKIRGLDDNIGHQNGSDRDDAKGDGKDEAKVVKEY